MMFDPKSPCYSQELNEICPFGQVKSLCGEIFAPQK